jgi:hypothetical protein
MQANTLCVEPDCPGILVPLHLILVAATEAAVVVVTVAELSAVITAVT